MSDVMTREHIERLAARHLEAEATHTRAARTHAEAEKLFRREGDLALAERERHRALRNQQGAELERRRLAALRSDDLDAYERARAERVPA